MNFIKIASIIIIIATARAWGASGENSISGKVKSFNEKTVTIDKNGKLFEFDIKRIKDKKTLKVGADIEISLSSK